MMTFWDAYDSIISEVAREEVVKYTEKKNETKEDKFMFYKVLFILTVIMFIRDINKYVKECKKYVATANDVMWGYSYYNVS